MKLILFKSEPLMDSLQSMTELKALMTIQRAWEIVPQTTRSKTNQRLFKAGDMVRNVSFKASITRTETE